MAKNFNVEDYIKDLSPELQEKARQCKNMDELMDLAGEEGVELSDEALANVSGGACTSTKCNHRGYNGTVNEAIKESSDGAGNSTWKVTKARCNKCNAVVNASKNCRINIPDTWSIYTQSVAMNDIF